MAFDAGMAIVILAIVLDRLTDHAGEWLDPRDRPAESAPRSAVCDGRPSRS